MKNPEPHPKLERAYDVFCAFYTSGWVLFCVYLIGCMTLINDSIVNPVLGHPAPDTAWCDIKPIPYSGVYLASFSGCVGLLLGSYINQRCFRV
jgi:hypothetical protein